jgi:hypothetical protein
MQQGTDSQGRRRSAARDTLARYLARYDEGEVIRWAFRGLLIGAVAVLLIDLQEMAAVQSEFADLNPASTQEPVLPPAVRTTGGVPLPSATDPRGNLTADQDLLRLPIRFELQAGGVLSATGSIDVGARQRFAEEIDARGEYVKTVSLNSPGGSLDDAIAMARLIRQKGLAAEVPDGALCASSCPLVLAGGAQRRIGAKAAIGVHQFYSVSTELYGPAQAMSDAQSTTARIARHLAAMGVDAAMWLLALDTPPRALYYLSAEEIQRYRLSTEKASSSAD